MNEHIIDDINYYNDARVRAGERGDWYKSLDEGRMIATVEVWTVREDFEDFEERTCRAKWEVCSTCDGKGTHVNPSIDCNGLGAEDFDGDPDFAEEYTSGAYDVSCAACHGRRVVAVPDEPEIVEYLEDQAQGEAEAHAERMAEIRMGC